MSQPLTALYALIVFAPYLLLELFAFRRSLRFSGAVTAILTGVLCAVQMAVGLWLPVQYGSIHLSVTGALLGGSLFLLLVRDQLGKKLFTLLMIANHANMAVAATECMAMFFRLSRYEWGYVLTALGMEALILTPMFLYVRQVYARSSDPKRRLRAWNYLWMIPLIFYLIWCLLTCFQSASQLTPAVSVRFLLVTLALQLGNVFVYVLVVQLIREHVQNQELREKEYMLTMRQTQYEHLQDRIDEARRTKHDMRHHIRVVSAYLSDGRLEELKAYLEKFSESIPDDSHVSYCGHYTANALLVYFAWQAKLSGIQYAVSVDLPESIGIPDEALTVVLGNLLENAVAACREETAAPAKITICGRRDDTAVFFQITNTCTRQLRRMPTGLYPSTKPEGMGVGLASVQNIAEQYDGLMELRHSGGRFTASVMLTIPEDF